MSARGWLRLAGGVALSAALFVGVVGWMHTPAARPWLAKFGVTCPIAKNANPVAMDSTRRRLLAAPDAPAAPAKPALGLALDLATLADGKAWATQHGIACTEHKRGYTYLQCPNVDSKAIGEDYAGAAPVNQLVLSFGAKGTLVGVQTYRRGVNPEAAAQLLAGTTEQLQKTLGAPTGKSGDPKDPAFRGATFAQAHVEYKFRDYLATLEESNLPGSGVVVMEKFYSTTL